MTFLTYQSAHKSMLYNSKFILMATCCHCNEGTLYSTHFPGQGFRCLTYSSLERYTDPVNEFIKNVDALTDPKQICGQVPSTVDITRTHLFKYIDSFPTKNWKFSDKSSDIFHISAQNIDCRYSLEPLQQGGSNEHPQSMFLSRNKKNNVYPFKPQFYFIKVGFKGVKFI